LKKTGIEKVNSQLQKTYHEPISSDLFLEILEKNQNNREEVRKLLRSYGLMEHEINQLIGEEPEKKEEDLDWLKEILLTRFKVRSRLIMEHMADENFFLSIENLRKEDEHLLDTLLKLQALQGKTPAPQPTQSSSMIPFEKLISEVDQDHAN
jgi:MoaA/NifB/PqqE/SkfB family radical SAM enzyme